MYKIITFNNLLFIGLVIKLTEKESEMVKASGSKTTSWLLSVARIRQETALSSAILFRKDVMQVITVYKSLVK